MRCYLNNTKATYSAILGVVLSNLRKQKNMEQGEVASKMGLTQASYSRLEAGKSTFSIDQMYQAAFALNLNGSDVIKEVESYSYHLQNDGINVVPQIRGNTSQAIQKQDTGNNIAKFVAGAALGAVLFSILSKK